LSYRLGGAWVRGAAARGGGWGLVRGLGGSPCRSLPRGFAAVCGAGGESGAFCLCAFGMFLVVVDCGVGVCSLVGFFFCSLRGMVWVGASRVLTSRCFGFLRVGLRCRAVRGGAGGRGDRFDLRLDGAVPLAIEALAAPPVPGGV